MSDYGRRAIGSTIEFEFTTSINGVATALQGGASSPDAAVVSVYKQGNSTEVTTGVTLTVNYDSRTGLNKVSIDTSSDSSFYSDNSDFNAVVTTGTIGGFSIAGFVVGSFHLDVMTTILEKTTKTIGRGTVTTGASTTSIPVSAFTVAGAALSSAATDQFKGRIVVFDGATTTASLRGQSSTITGSTNTTTPTFTVDTLTTAPASGDLFSVI